MAEGIKDRTAHALDESQLRLATLAVGVAVYQWDPASDHLLWTEGLTSVFGYRLAEVQPTRGWWSDRVHPDDRGQGAGLGYAALTQGGSSYTAEYRFRAGDGRYLDVLDRGLVVVEPGGKTRAVGGMVDITERKRLEEQLLHAQKMDAFGQLAGGIAHDFNNLLTAIAGYTELLLGQLDPADPATRDAEEIAKVADRATSLTRQLLAFSRKQVLRPRAVDLNTTIEGLSEMLRQVIGEHIELVTDLRPDTGKITIDPAQLEQVILNLCVNARDAMPAGGRLTIETRKIEPFSWVLLTIGDTGVGMSPETRSHIYEPFFTTKEAGKGTGLGLATVYGIVGQSGGDIDVESQPGHGTTFRIWFPLADEEAEAIAPEKGQADDSGSETVLLVEDEEVVRTLASRALAERGYMVLEAASGDEALAIAKAHAGAIDIVVTDVVMPGLNGRELYRRLRSLHPEAFALFMSGYADDAILRDLMHEAGTAFMPKPFTPGLLASKVRHVLDGGSTG
jgi:PAS domain S-box-containing protein